MYQTFMSVAGQKVIVNERDGVTLSFTENPEIPEYQRYLEWVAAGNEPEIIEG